MTEPRYIDENLAKARRMYIENRINQEAGKGVWKGRLYIMVPYTVPLLGISMEVPDFLYSGRKEERILMAEFSMINSPRKKNPGCLSNIRKQIGSLQCAWQLVAEGA